MSDQDIINIELSDEELIALEKLAKEKNKSVEEIINIILETAVQAGAKVLLEADNKPE